MRKLAQYCVQFRDPRLTGGLDANCDFLVAPQVDYTPGPTDLVIDRLFNEATKVATTLSEIAYCIASHLALSVWNGRDPPKQHIEHTLRSNV